MSKTGTETSSFGVKARVNHNASKFYASKLYTELEQKIEVSNIENQIPREVLNTIILGSAENMQELNENSVHLMITSTPYNV